MNWIIQWVGQIMLYIILATCVDLVIPANQMKRYVSFVLKVFLLSIYLQPLFLLFSISTQDISLWLDHVLIDEQHAYSDMKEAVNADVDTLQGKQMENIMETMEDDWKEQANTDLDGIDDMHITNVDIQATDMTVDSIDYVTVFLSRNDPQIVQTVEKVEVTDKETSTQKVQDNEEIEAEVREQLSRIWNIPAKNIVLKWKDDHP